VVTSRSLYLGFLVLIAVERFVELAISRANVRGALARGGYEVGRGHYRVMVLLHTSFLFSCGLEVLLYKRPFLAVLGFPALSLALFAQALRYAAILTLGERWNVRIVVWPFAAPVTKGPYRLVRHPNYLAVVIEILFVPLVHSAFVTAAVFSLCNACLLVVRIRQEERALGPRYAHAFRDRPRFFPRVFSG
jgi:methyltransferase